MDAKATLISTAREMGFERAVVASLEPLVAEQKFFEEWLGKGYAGTMHYLGRDPEKRNAPKMLCPSAYSVLILFASYYSAPQDDPGPDFGRVARYAVGRDYHNVLAEKLAEFKERVEAKLARPILGKAFTDDVQLYEQALAARSGLGFSGKNTMIIGPKMMGSYHFIAELFTDLELEPDEAYKGTCGNCFRCASACPTKAIVAEGEVDARLCISFLTIENKDGIPVELREKVGDWVFGCDVCQEVCPYNQRPPESPWKEFHPASGVGHYLNLSDILGLKDKADFVRKFADTPLLRPKRKGMVRNALVVMGNRKPEAGPEVLKKFVKDEEDKMLLEHALWAMSQYDAGEKIVEAAIDASNREQQGILKDLLLSMQSRN